MRVRFAVPHGTSEWSNTLEVNGVHTHEWGVAEVVTVPTPDADGEVKYTCECGEEEFETITFGELITTALLTVWMWL